MAFLEITALRLDLRSNYDRISLSNISLTFKLIITLTQSKFQSSTRISHRFHWKISPMQVTSAWTRDTAPIGWSTRQSITNSGWHNLSSEVTGSLTLQMTPVTWLRERDISKWPLNYQKIAQHDASNSVTLWTKADRIVIRLNERPINLTAAIALEQ